MDLGGEVLVGRETGYVDADLSDDDLRDAFADTRDRQQYPPVSGNVGIEMDTMAQPSANTHANPHSQFSQPNHDGTIDPARLVLGHNTQQMAE